MKSHRSQNGVALITVLLIVVIATVLGVAMTTDQKFAITRARTFFEQGIVRQYAYGGEELARQILYQDFVDAPETDHLSENWAGRQLKFEFEEGEIELLIEDLQAKINLNSLAQEGRAAQDAKQRLTNLLTQQGIDRAYVDRIGDWIDSNNSVNPLGAEDFDYLGLERPYRTSGQLMADITELRLILEMDREQYALIAPYVTALPVATSNINVNTISAHVLSSLAPGLPLVTAEGIVSARDQNQPYNSIDDFTGDPAITSANRIQVKGLSVQSNFFQVSIRARYRNRFGYLTSIIQRDPTDGSMRVIYRDQSKKILPIVGDPATALDQQRGA